jgi:hypothetical protein
MMMKYWSVGVVDRRVPKPHHSITPILHYSKFLLSYGIKNPFMIASCHSFATGGTMP